MNKGVLEQYIDACELIKETEADIRRVKNQRKTIKMCIRDRPAACIVSVMCIRHWAGSQGILRI